MDKLKAKKQLALKGKPGQQLSKVWKNNLHAVCELDSIYVDDADTEHVNVIETKDIILH